MNRAESGVGDSVPFFVRIGEKVRATFYARIYEALLCPAEYPFASSTRSKRTHIANAGSAGLSAPVKSLVFAAMRCRDGLATLSALKSRSLSIRHKGALGVRGLLRDASIYRPSNRREAEREAANRFAGIRPPCCPTLCVPPLRTLPCRAEPRAPVAAARPNTFWSKLHCPSICPRRAARSRAAPQRIRV